MNSLSNKNIEKQTARLEAFSDGIFGVAITLLAIEIGITQYEGATDATLWQKIVAKWPAYFTYFNSFATVLLIWMGHNKLLNQLYRANHSIILLNSLVLLFVVLFPFPTKIVGTFIGTGAVHTAVAFYAGFAGIIVVSMVLLTLGIINNPSSLIAPQKSLPWLRAMLKSQLIGAVIYAIATLMAFYSPFIALALTFGMWVFWAIITKDSDSDT